MPHGHHPRPGVMTAIWKFPLELTDEQSIVMPFGSELVAVGLDPAGEPCVWAAVDRRQEDAKRRIRIAGTGHPIAVGAGHPIDGPPSSVARAYVGAIFQAPFVWHVLDLGEKPYTDPEDES